jgi:hypothetical protein
MGFSFFSIIKSMKWCKSNKIMYVVLVLQPYD